MGVIGALGKKRDRLGPLGCPHRPLRRVVLIFYISPSSSSDTLRDPEECLILQIRDPKRETSLRCVLTETDCNAALRKGDLSQVLVVGGPKNHNHGRNE